MESRPALTLFTRRLGPGTGTGGVVYGVAVALRARGFPVEVCAKVVDHAPPGVVVTQADTWPRGSGLRVAFDRVPGAEVVRASGGVHRAWTAVGADGAYRRWRSRLGPERAVEREEARAFGLARCVIANSEKVARELRWFHGLEDTVRLVRTGVDLDRYRPDEQVRHTARSVMGARGRVAAFVGHSWRRKGLAVAIDAFLQSADDRDQLWVLGSDAGSARWRRTLTDPRVHFLGARPPEDWLPGADALLSPTLYDAASNVVLEALACGVPPVVSLADGSSEVVTGPGLRVADPRSVQGFAEGLRLAWEDGHLRERSRQDAERWPTSRMVDGLVDVISSVEGRRGT